MYASFDYKSGLREAQVARLGVGGFLLSPIEILTPAGDVARATGTFHAGRAVATLTGKLNRRCEKCASQS